MTIYIECIERLSHAKGRPGDRAGFGVALFSRKGALCMQDVVIIGGGAVGCAVARELSRWQLDVCLVE